MRKSASGRRLRRNDYCVRHSAALALVMAMASVFLFANAFAATGDQKCAATKMKAAGKKFFAKTKCHQKAILKGIATDPVCLAKAEDKFVAAIAKADSVGICPGTAVGMETIVDDCLDTLAGNITPATFAVTSPTLTEGGAIPTTHVCTAQGGMNQSPQLAWVDPPAGTMSFAMVLTDQTNDLVHSVFYDIPSTLIGLPANVERLYAPPSVTGMHTTLAYDNQRGWAGPCSPANTHTYEIAIYAINVSTLPGSTMATTSTQAVASIMANNLGVAKLTATFTTP